jgi:hypothetical protein
MEVVEMRRISIAFAAVAALLMISQIAAADSIISFQDHVKYWPNYPSRDATDNSQDTIGEPDITGGRVIVDDAGFLKQVQFDFIGGWAYQVMKPGDLFLDLDSNGSWDYVVSSYNDRDNSDENNKYIPSGSVGLYSTTGGSLLLTGVDNPPQGYWHGYLFRNDHPFAYTGLTDYIGSASVSGGYPDNNPIVFTLPGQTLRFGNSLTIGYTENCANDVVLETVAPVPEPSTIPLVGLGLAFGFIALKRKRA